MEIQLTFNQELFKADLSQPIDISIPIHNGDQNPNCYFADDVHFEVIRSGDFVGAIAQGGVVNHKRVHIAPHGNGTHTECFGHIFDAPEGTINKSLRQFHFMTQLITIAPQKTSNGDFVIHVDDFLSLWQKKTEAVIIRTLPNAEDKLAKNYSGTNPPYLDPEILQIISKNGVKHLLVDLPSIDKEVDGGALKAHRNFWGLPNLLHKASTITELIYVQNSVKDGYYLLNLQIASFEIDVSPSKPVLFNLVKCSI
ncbi:cyclase family protein [Fulvivirga sp. M361]|uniref:cyclase family protein n=1 Tax=Fulvivirga sp. M361 TaxID=2594266 RepID=UPI00117BD9B8|nr:cyclase family protein [Fulvivirga sp. M361]TRX53652.1 cyclase family protein [Fulvivirga sp. M361]